MIVGSVSAEVYRRIEEHVRRERVPRPVQAGERRGRRRRNPPQNKTRTPALRVRHRLTDCRIGQEVSVPEGTGIFVDFDQVNEVAGVSTQRSRFRPAQIQLAEPQSAAEDTARSAQSLVAGETSRSIG